MPRKRQRQKKPAEEQTQLAIRVERYDAHVAGAVSYQAYAPQYAWNLDDDDPVYEFTSQVTITGIATYPPGRAGDTYDVTVSGVASPSHDVYSKLKDIHARNEHGSPRYRTYRGIEIPIYVPPKGLGLLDKVRGESRWIAWLFVPPRFVSDLLALLGQQSRLFLSLHEYKNGRSRWVRGVTLQTTDPEEE